MVEKAWGHVAARSGGPCVSWLHDSQQGQRDVVWVTHAGVARCVQWLLHYGQAQPTSADWTLPAPAYGGWQQLPWQMHAVALQTLG